MCWCSHQPCFFPLPDPVEQDSKSSYSYKEMMEMAKRLRSPGYSQRTGRKLKRRSQQPGREREKVRAVLLALVIVLMATVIGVVFWLVTRDHVPVEKSPGDSVPVAPKVE
jgi:hypothetical protein